MARFPAILLAAVGAWADASELAPSADLGALPMIAPREWLLQNFAPDDNTVGALVPRRREIAIGFARPVWPAEGIGVQLEGVWSPVRAESATMALRVDELILGGGLHWERPMAEDRFGWRLSGTLGVRALTDAGSKRLDTWESALLHGGGGSGTGQPEHPDRADGIGALNAAARFRVTDSAPISQAPLDLAISGRALRIFASDGRNDPLPDLRLGAVVVMPTRTTQSWFGATWQGHAQPANSQALAEVRRQEDGWWFVSGGALRLGAQGDWLVEVGSALNPRTGTAVGTLGVARTGDPPRANADGTSTLALVVLPGESTAYGLATGDEMRRSGPFILKREIRTIVGSDPADAAGATTDAIRLDVLLRGQAPWRPLPLLAIGPEVGFGLGVRHDAARFPAIPPETRSGTASLQRAEVVADAGLGAQLSTGWKGGIGAIEGALGWSWWRTLGGPHQLSGGGGSIDLPQSGGGPIVRLGLLARF